MAKKNTGLLARIRYVDYQKPTGPKGERDAYVIEIYDPECGWSYSSGYYFSKSELYPNAEEANYIPYQIVPKIFEMMKIGYHVHFATADEA